MDLDEIDRKLSEMKVHWKVDRPETIIKNGTRLFPKHHVNSITHPILDDKLKEKFLKP